MPHGEHLQLTAGPEAQPLGKAVAVHGHDLFQRVEHLSQLRVNLHLYVSFFTAITQNEGICG